MKQQISPSGHFGLLLMGFSIFGLWFYCVQSQQKDQPPEVKQRFQVVSKYNGCDVVRYESGQYPRYVYLLDCKK